MKAQFYFWSLTVLASLLFNSPPCFAQNAVGNDSRISDAFGSSYVKLLEEKNPDLLVYYTFYLDNAWEYVNLPIDKTKNLPALSLLPGKKESSKGFNLLLYKVTRYYDRPNYYLHNNKVIRLLSEQEFMERFNTYKNAKH